jgi:S-adenosylhomocysteine hydrolase
LGKKRNELAEAEMPGLMALRAEYKDNNLQVLVCWMFAHDNQTAF